LRITWCVCGHLNHWAQQMLTRSRNPNRQHHWQRQQGNIESALHFQRLPERQSRASAAPRATQVGPEKTARLKAMSSLATPAPLEGLKGKITRSAPQTPKRRRQRIMPSPCQRTCERLGSEFAGVGNKLAKGAPFKVGAIQAPRTSRTAQQAQQPPDRNAAIPEAFPVTPKLAHPEFPMRPHLNPRTVSAGPSGKNTRNGKKSPQNQAKPRIDNF